MIWGINRISSEETPLPAGEKLPFTFTAFTERKQKSIRGTP